jgi:Fic family protein
MLAFLPLNIDFETNAVLKKLASAHRALGELKGVIGTIPNQHILLETLILREARESSAIENIISTFDEIYQSDFLSNQFVSPAAKEVHHYAKALLEGFRLIKPKGLLTNNHILQIQRIIEQNNAGYRKLPGTKLLNDRTGQVVYIPPQDYETIVSLMNNLEQFINDESLIQLDPLVKMAIIHHQFESIHPFYDGNGRTGRIINILYLVHKGLLHLPILYLSKYIINHKTDYYRLLQHVRNSNTWEEWIIFMLSAVEETALETLTLVNQIDSLMQEFKLLIRNKHAKIYSQDLLNNLFRYPYTKIEFVQKDLQVSRNTAIRYLEELVKSDILIKHKIGRDNYFENRALFKLLSGSSTI